MGLASVLLSVVNNLLAKEGERASLILITSGMYSSSESLSRGAPFSSFYSVYYYYS